MTLIIKLIQFFSGLLALFATLNLLVLLLSEKIQHFIPIRLTPVTSYMDAVIAFGIGAGVFCLAHMAHGKSGGGGH
jgi:hypothetical protein